MGRNRKKNRSGPTGVDFDQRCGKYRSRITRNSKVYLLGYFATEEEAVAARKNAESSHLENKRFSYTHSYSTVSSLSEAEGDPYLLYVSSQVRNAPETPECTLRLAVLTQSIKDVLQTTNKSAHRNALDWFDGKSKSPPTYSFEDICDILSLDQKKISDGINSACKDSKRALRQIGRRLVKAVPKPEVM